MLADNHYYPRASKASPLETPDKLNVPAAKFKEKFGVDWLSVLESGAAVNAKDACEQLSVDMKGLSELWNQAKDKGNVVKFDDGLICGKLEVSKSLIHMYVFKGVFMELRNQFVAPGGGIYYYNVEWDMLQLSWADFNNKLVGPTDPATAPADSIRGTLFTEWEELGLTEEPDTSNNCVHASASPLEALLERMNWLGGLASKDAFGKLLLHAGVTEANIKEWSRDPQAIWISHGPPTTSSVFDAVRGLDADRCVVQCQLIAGVPAVAEPISGSAGPRVAEDAFGGLLWKKKPPAMFQVLKFQQRAVYLDDGKMYWVEPGKNPTREVEKFSTKGPIDFGVNKCMVEPVKGHATRFVLKAGGGRWSQCSSFTGAGIGREFIFDAAGSEHSRDAWLTEISKHLMMGVERRGFAAPLEDPPADRV